MISTPTRTKRKAVSPVVATMLLIAVAVSVGIMVTTFVTSFVTTETQGDITCAINTNYIIESAEFNRSGMLHILLLKITNKNKNPLYGFGAIMDNGTTIVQFNSSHTFINQGGITSANKLQQEESVFVQVDLSNTTYGYPTFGASLESGSDIEVKILNDACPGVSANTNDVT